MVQLVVRVDIGVVTYEAMTPQCGRSVVQVLIVSVDIGVVTYEALTPQCGSVVQVLVVRVDREVLTSKVWHPNVERSHENNCNLGCFCQMARKTRIYI